jgi:glutathione S-transferase
VIRESTVICEYLDEAFPEPPLRPADALGRAAMRVWTKAVDEGLQITPSENQTSPPASSADFVNGLLTKS